MREQSQGSLLSFQRRICEQTSRTCILRQLTCVLRREFLQRSIEVGLVVAVLAVGLKPVEVNLRVSQADIGLSRLC
jgi:hypothetical protein